MRFVFVLSYRNTIYQQLWCSSMKIYMFKRICGTQYNSCTDMSCYNFIPLQAFTALAVNQCTSTLMLRTVHQGYEAKKALEKLQLQHISHFCFPNFMLHQNSQELTDQLFENISSQIQSNLYAIFVTACKQ